MVEYRAFEICRTTHHPADRRRNYLRNDRRNTGIYVHILSALYAPERKAMAYLPCEGDLSVLAKLLPGRERFTG